MLLTKKILDSKLVKGNIFHFMKDFLISQEISDDVSHCPLTRFSHDKKNTDPSPHDALKNVGDLASLKKLMLSLNNPPLQKTATQIVFGEGVLNPSVMVIGEAPGQDEDVQGRPFVGQSGKLLEKALNTIGLFREKNCYISNIVPYRPMGNRTPSNDEVSFYLPFLKKHIEYVKPQLLLLVGSVSSKALLDTNEGITTLRGKILHCMNIQTIATYHPAFLLRSPGQKAKLWKDLLTLSSLVNITK